MQTSNNETSTSELMAQLSRQVRDLLRQELSIARQELTAKALDAGIGAGLLAASGVLAFTGFLCISAAMALMLAKVMPRWLAFAVVGTLLASVSGFLAARGLAELRDADLIPHRTIRLLQEDAQWLTDQTK